MLSAANYFRQILRDIRGQKLRTFLTVGGIVWGTLAVSLLLAFGQGMHEKLIKTSKGLGNGIVIAWPSRTSMPYEGLGRGRRITMTERDIELLRERVQTLGAISIEYRDDFKLVYGSRVLSVPVHGVEPVFADMRNLIPEAGGRFINPIDEKNKRRVAFIGTELAEELFGDRDAVGDMLKIEGSPYQVIGIMKEKDQDSNYSGPDKRMVFIPASTFRALSGQKYIDNFIYTAATVADTKLCRDEVQNTLAARHRFHPDDEEALQEWDTTDMAVFLDTFMVAFRLFLGIVGSLTLVVGGIGVSNIMNVAVEERTREIGIKMALGSRPGSILGQFLVETLVITGSGGLIGLGLSFLICSILPPDMHEVVGTPSFSPLVAIATTTLLGVIGLVAGYFPARAASRLDPVVAMKM